MKIEIETADVDLRKAREALAELKREAALRCKVYPRWIIDKKMMQADADMRMAALASSVILVNAVYESLVALGANDRQAAELPNFCLGKVTADDRVMQPQCRFCHSFGKEETRTAHTPSGGLWQCLLPRCPGALGPVTRVIFEGGN